MELKKKNVEEKEITKANGGMFLALGLLGFVGSIALIIVSIVCFTEKLGLIGGLLIGAGIILFFAATLICCGLHIINPNEALVFTLFGTYYGTIKQPGYYFMNPFASAASPAREHAAPLVNVSSSDISVNAGISVSKKISTKITTFHNEKQKVNDVLGNPIIIGAVVIWKVKDPTKAVFEVENYASFLSTQCDSTIRNIARLYPYDVMNDEETEEKTLRGSSQEIADSMTRELQQRVAEAGLEVIEVRITHLSYAEEIAAAMLQRQQATAIIAAKKKIVEGAVSMVKMAIDQLGEEEVVVLDEERKAAMISNLLVVLCGNKEAQPIVNSGTIY